MKSLSLPLLKVVAWFWLGIVPLQAAYDVFLKLDGIKGESKDPAHPGWSDVVHFSNWTFPGSGPADPPSSVALIKEVDAASPLLLEACATGALIPEVRLDLVVHLERSARFYEILLREAQITSVQLNSPEQRVPLEILSLRFAQIEWTYTLLELDGTARQNLAAAWDIARDEAGAAERPLLRARASTGADGGLRLRWSAQRGRTYAIYSSTDVLGPYELFDHITVQESEAELVLSQAAPSRFFVIEETP